MYNFRAGAKRMSVAVAAVVIPYIFLLFIQRKIYMD